MVSLTRSRILTASALVIRAKARFSSAKLIIQSYLSPLSLLGGEGKVRGQHPIARNVSRSALLLVWQASVL